MLWRGVLPCLLALACAVPATAFAAAIVVTTADGSAPDAECALEEAVDSAVFDTAVGGCTAGDGADVIGFAPGVEGTIEIEQTLDLEGEIALQGPGADRLAISGRQSVRVIAVSQGADVTIEGITIRQGLVSNFGFGGGIAVSGPANLVLRDCTLLGNEAFNGGGMMAVGATVRVERCAFVDNRARQSGGGIVNSLGTLDLVNSTVTGNVASGEMSSTGGGVMTAGEDEDVASTRIASSTIARNFAPTAANLSAFAPSTTTLGHTLLAEPQGGGTNCAGTGSIASLGHNLSDDLDPDCNLVEPTDVTEAGPVVFSPEPNGGPTATMALLPGSPAIDAGAASCADPDGAPLATDQRGPGFPRVVDGDLVPGARCDIGAFERRSSRAVIAFPGPPPCALSLQACIDLTANPGDVVEIAAGTYDESIELDECIGLRGVPSLETQFAASRHLVAITPADDADCRISIENLRFLEGFVRVRHEGTGTLELVLTGNVVLGNPNLPAIDISAGFSGDPRGPIDLEITENGIQPLESETNPPLGIMITPFLASELTGRIRQNFLFLPAGEQGRALLVLNNGSAMDIDVVSNQFVGEAPGSAIDITQDGIGGSLQARVLGNLVRGFGQLGSAAVAGYATAGSLDVTIVNNTLFENGSAISLGGRADLGGTLAGVVANNLIVGNLRGYNLDPQLGVPSDRNNLYFDNEVDLGDGEVEQLPGPGSVFADPLFGDDPVPGAGSPAIDAGDSSAVPPDLVSDLLGGPRIRGLAVDIGAVEAPEPGALGAALAAGLALAALAQRRSRLRARSES